MKEALLDRKQGFNNQISNFELQQVNVNSFLGHCLKHTLQSPLTGSSILNILLCYLKLFIVFVYCIVCQMSKLVDILRLLHMGIRFSGEPRQPLFVPEDCHWVTRSYQNVKPQVKL